MRKKKQQLNRELDNALNVLNNALERARDLEEALNQEVIDRQGAELHLVEQEKQLQFFCAEYRRLINRVRDLRCEVLRAQEERDAAQENRDRYKRRVETERKRASEAEHRLNEVRKAAGQ